MMISYHRHCWSFRFGTLRALALALLLFVGPLPTRAGTLQAELKRVPERIVFETYRDGNWELFICNADGSNCVNLTRTPNVNELYPHVAPDGKKICFVVDAGKGATRSRSVYYMNMDGTQRTLVAHNARQPCWNSSGTAIAYLKGESDKFAIVDFATRGIFIYDLATGAHRQHPNKKIRHLYNLCWSPDGKWFLATVHGGMGFSHAILAIPIDRTDVYDLHIHGCRPDISPDGAKVVWGASDYVLATGDLDLTGRVPKLRNRRDIVTSAKPIKIYHTDWSPDGKYISFSRGPIPKKRLGPVCEIVGVRAKGWNICVADATAANRWVQITTDGHSNKEPDWVPVSR